MRGREIWKNQQRNGREIGSKLEESCVLNAK